MIGQLKINLTNGLVLGLPVLLFLILVFGFDFNGLYGQDSHTYLKHALELKQFTFQGEPPGVYIWPKGYPALGYLLSYLGFSMNFTLLLVSISSALIALYFVHRIIQMLYKEDGYWWLLIGATTSTYFIRGAVLVMSDMLAACLIVLAFYWFIRFNQQRKPLLALLFFVFAICSFFVRYASFALWVIPMLIIFVKLVNALRLTYKIVFGGLLLLLVFALMSSNNSFLPVVGNILDQWSLGNFFRRTFDTPSGMLRYRLPNLLQVSLSSFHPGYLSIGILLIPFVTSLKFKNWSIWISLLSYYLFLAGLEIQNYRYFVISHPLILIILHPAFVSLKQFLISRKMFQATMFIFLLLNLGIFFYSFQKTYRVHKLEKKIVSAIVDLNDNSKIYSFEVDQSFPSYGIFNEVENLFIQDIYHFQPGSLAVFNEHKLRDKWKGTTVMNNWNRLVSKHQLDTLISFDEGWEIYRIMDAKK